MGVFFSGVLIWGFISLRLMHATKRLLKNRKGVQSNPNHTKNNLKIMKNYSFQFTSITPRECFLHYQLPIHKNKPQQVK